MQSKLVTVGLICLIIGFLLGFAVSRNKSQADVASDDICAQLAFNLIDTIRAGEEPSENDIAHFRAVCPDFGPEDLPER